MARKYKIRWKESDEVALKKAVRSYNSKIEYIKQKANTYNDSQRNQILERLPDKVSYRELRKEDIQTRGQLNAVIKSLTGFKSSTVYEAPLTSRQKKTIKKEIDKFNSKISRLAKKYSKIDDYNKRSRMLSSLPKKMKYSELIKPHSNMFGDILPPLIQSEAGYKMELDALRSFTKDNKAQQIVTPENNLYNVAMTKWQMQQMKKREKIVNEKRSERLERLKELEAKSRGQGLDHTVGEVGMGRQELKALNPTHAFTDSQSKRDIDRKFKTLQLESHPNYFKESDMRWRDNYTRTLLEELGDVPEVRRIVDKINNMPLDEVILKFYTEIGIFEYSYPLDYEQRVNSINALTSIWLKDSDLYH